MLGSSAQIIHWLLVYRYLVLFPLVVVEGPILTVLGGFLASLGYLSAPLVYGVVVLGDLAGDTIYYGIGRWGRRRVALRMKSYAGLTPQRIERLEGHFRRHTGKTLVLGKLSHAIGSTILLAAGIVKVPYRDFIWFNFLATIPKSLILLLVGFYFGSAYSRINRYFDYTAVAMFAVVVIFLLFYIGTKTVAKRLSRDL